MSLWLKVNNMLSFGLTRSIDLASLGLRTVDLDYSFLEHDLDGVKKSEGSFFEAMTLVPAELLLSIVFFRNIRIL
jgi:hypothetical protein